ncbi:phage tail protein [Roseivirga sp. 4D4]|uniref:phage tail protein n=1 Tax=Roseivirga sp. 4D4 TaxID=1889784 RepID=UPI000852DB3B|nr:tail fiber protein [Roseivirga sp. 4D4]OEK00315.1 phage tail protein [Roseivirga sp. 4D4]
MDPFLAEIIMFGGNFAPRAWAFCDGQLLPINQNSALFSLLGTIYGGDGRTTFALPDLRGRVPVHPGTGPGLTTVKLGERGGTETNTLTLNNLPNHTHNATLTNGQALIPVQSAAGEEDEANPAAGVLTNTGTDNYTSSGGNATYGGSAVPVTGTVTVLPAGNQQPVNNMQPFLGLNYIIALQGVFPSRN